MPCIPKSCMIRKIDMKEEAQTWQKGTKYDQQFKENAVRYRLDHPNLHSRKRLKIWESVILLSKHGFGQPGNMKAVCQQEDPAIIPVMRQKRSHVSNES